MDEKNNYHGYSFLCSNLIGLEITINGDLLISDVEPCISSENRTMVPVTVITRTLDLDVTWNPTTKEVTLTDYQKKSFIPSMSISFQLTVLQKNWIHLLL